nr:hypothetical protein [uncultured Clostridium sp.]
MQIRDSSGVMPRDDDNILCSNSSLITQSNINEIESSIASVVFPVKK